MPETSTGGGGNGYIDYLNGQAATLILNPVDGSQIVVTNDLLSILQYRTNFMQWAGNNQNKYVTSTVTTAYGTYLASIGSAAAALVGAGAQSAAVSAGAEAVMTHVDGNYSALANVTAPDCAQALAQAGLAALAAAATKNPYAIGAAGLAAGNAYDKCVPLVEGYGRTSSGDTSIGPPSAPDSAVAGLLGHA